MDIDVFYTQRRRKKKNKKQKKKGALFVVKSRTPDFLLGGFIDG